MSDIKPFHEEIQHHNKMYFSKKEMAWVEFPQDVLSRIAELLDKSGVYILYDNHKKPVYIGKSYDLGNRILSSAKERKAMYYAYSIVGNRADTDIYEVYYIAHCKPLLNRVSNSGDSPTIKLPLLDFSEIFNLYEGVSL